MDFYTELGEHMYGKITNRNEALCRLCQKQHLSSLIPNAIHHKLVESWKEMTVLIVCDYFIIRAHSSNPGVTNFHTPSEKQHSHAPAPAFQHHLCVTVSQCVLLCKIYNSMR